MNTRLAKRNHKQLIELAKKTIIPPLNSKYHKGQVGGRVCVVGGSFKYCGAPFFAANATMLYGSDLTYLVCSSADSDLATIIKGYSPNLMVNPVLGKRDLKCDSFLSNVHSVVIGPGLGRREDDEDEDDDNDSGTISNRDLKFDNVIKILKYCIETKIFVVLDADGLYLLSNDHKYKRILKDILLKDASYVTLTPNVIEYKRLTEEYPQILKMFPGLTVVQKGFTDIISTSTQDRQVLTLENHVESKCLKRCGGQGDTLSGCLATQLGWCNILLRDGDRKIWPEREELKDMHEYKMLSSYITTTTVKLASSMAFEDKKRSMQTTDLNNRVGDAFYELFGDTVDPNEP